MFNGSGKDDLGMGAAKLLQMVDKLIEFLGGRKQDLDMHTVIAGYTVALNDLGALPDVGIKFRFALRVHVQIDEGLDHIPQFGCIDLRLIAGKNPGTFQPGDACRNGRAG